MSASETNIDRQTRRHIGPLAGIALCIAFVALLYGAYILFLAGNGQEPREASTNEVNLSVTTD